MKKTTITLLAFSLLLPACQSPKENQQTIAANETVAQYMASFEGRGDQADDSQPTPPEEALKHFRFPNDMALDLLAAEPLIVQPVELNFDHRGRLWVVQYSQYPFPAGLKIVNYDYHLRAQFDKMPEPPPTGTQGADKITLLEDTDGDGVLDKATDAITGLNIATGVTWGRGRIWVLNPPFLLAYPDPDGDGIPDGKAVVQLKGFGLEDTHAIANSLRWGPDGWLYGAQGSTTWATISSSVSKDVHFKGQAIWRYHPETEVFEIFAEGGGNTFHVEIDEKGRIYSGHNGGNSRGQYYKQGAYYAKNWGKHGALTNPYAFGFFQHMTLEGENLRFTHGFIKYEGGSLPARYHGSMIAMNPLHNFIQVSDFEAMGSTFKNIDRERILTTEDHWFRPVDIKAGPNGGVYLADWYDSRLSHVDPRDTWHKGSGRIYRLRNKDTAHEEDFDLSTYSTSQLLELLSNPNKWFRQQALRQFGDRKDLTAIPPLKQMLTEKTGQLALEALWALNLSGGFDETVAHIGLAHADPYVRMWTVRLLGDNKEAENLANALVQLAAKEPHPEVRSQLAASAKRLPPKEALPIIHALMQRNEDADDPHNPLLIWWALETHAETDRSAVLALFEEANIWQQPIVRNTLLERLMQRYVMAGGSENLATATQLLKLAPDTDAAQPLMTGLMEGLRGKDMSTLPAELLAELDKYQPSLGEGKWTLQLRQGKKEALDKVLTIVVDPQADRLEKLNYIKIMGEINQPAAVPVLLDVVRSSAHSGAIRQAALQTLARYNQPEIGEKVVQWYPDLLRADPGLKLTSLNLLSSRADWARGLFDAIEVSRQIHANDIPVQIIRQIKLLDNSEMETTTSRIWPDIKLATSAEKQERITSLKKLIQAKPGNPEKGKIIFQRVCSSCHQLYGEGGAIGPDLTGYDRRNISDLLINTVDPNAEIREGYVNYLIKTADGRTLAGIIVNNSGQQIELRTFDGQLLSLPQSQIVEMKAQPVSLMPEGLLAPLSEEEVRDLFGYLGGNDS